MKIEVCDLCGRRVNNLNSTNVIIKDYKGVKRGVFGTLFPTSRKFRGVICDGCLELLREGNCKQIPKAIIHEERPVRVVIDE